MEKSIKKLIDILEANSFKIQAKIETSEAKMHDKNNLHHLLLRYTKTLTSLYNRLDVIKKESAKGKK